MTRRHVPRPEDLRDGTVEPGGSRCPAGEKTGEFADKLAPTASAGPRSGQEGHRLGVGMDKNSHMEIEAYVQSLLITAKDFPQTLQTGFAQLLKKK